LRSKILSFWNKEKSSPWFWLSLTFVWYFVLYLIRFGDFIESRGFSAGEGKCGQIMMELEALGRLPPIFFSLASFLFISKGYGQKLVSILWGIGIAGYFILYLMSPLDYPLGIQWIETPNTILWVSPLAGILWGICNIRSKYGQQLFLISLGAWIAHGISQYVFSYMMPCCFHCAG